LVREPLAGRFLLHDLLKDYAGQLAQAHDDQSSSDAALQRTIEFFVYTAVVASNTAAIMRPILPDLAPPMGIVVTFADAERARSWLRSEYPNLLSLIRYTSNRRWHVATYQLTRAAWRYQYEHEYHDDCLETHELALLATRALGDDAAAADLLVNRAGIHFLASHCDEALLDLQVAEDLGRRSADAGVLARSISNCAKVLRRLGQYDAARLKAAQAAVLHEEAGDLAFAIDARLEVADIMTIKSEPTEAITVSRTQLRIARHLGGYPYASALFAIGHAELRRHRPRVARRFLERALACLTWVPPPLASDIRIDLGTAYRELGEFDLALHEYSSVLGITEHFRDRAAESSARAGIGATLAAAGDHLGALDQYRHAWELVQHTDAKLEQARALDGLAAMLAHTDPAGGQDYGQRALALYEELDLPEKEEIQARLTTTGSLLAERVPT
jgi:tetratricopeptide (TPR) repeat protein